jgi:uncharacterized protein YegP (UPF0339 family)
MYFETYQDQNGEYRRRERSGGDITADSGEGYSSKDGARRSVKSLKEGSNEAETREA